MHYPCAGGKFLFSGMPRSAKYAERMKKVSAGQITRRSFAKSAAAIAAATTLPKWFLEECQSNAATLELGPNDQPAIALSGCGGMGRGDAKNASRFARVVAICDLDDANLAEAQKMFP